MKFKENNIEVKSVMVFFGILFFIIVMSNLASAPINDPGEEEPACVITTSNNCRAPNNIVMKLSGTTNAHATLSNQNNFPSNLVLCCNFRGTSQCNGNDKITGLSSLTNSHAERPARNAYQNNVCYTGLSDIWSASGTQPDANEIEIISLSSYTNAHIGTNYAIKVYGTPVEAGGGGGGEDECILTSAYWKIGNTRINQTTMFVRNGSFVNLFS